MRHHLHDEEREEGVRGANMCERARGIEDIKSRANEQEERELHEDDDAAGEQRELRLRKILCSQQALDDELIRAVAGHGEEAATDEAAPEGVGLGERKSEVKDGEFVCRGCGVMDGAPAARGFRAQRPERE